MPPITTQLTALSLLLLSATTAAGEEHRVIAPGHEQEILALARPIRLGDPVAGGYRLTDIGIEGRSFTFILGGEGLMPVRLRVAPDDEERSQLVDVTPPEGELSAAGNEAVNRLRVIVLPRVNAAFWRRILMPPTAGGAAPTPPLSATATNAVAAAAFVAILWLEIRASRRRRSAFLALLLATIPMVLWLSWRNVGPTGADDLEAWLSLREHHLVKLALGVAIAAIFTAAAAALRRGRRIDRTLCLDVTLVSAWSLVVRFGLTTANVLTDGGSGWSRLLEYRRGFGGLAVLLDLVLPNASMWDAILVPRLLAALSPPVLVLFARAVGVKRQAALFAGLALASLPLHAALYSSDFLSGAIVTVLLVGLTLVAVGVNRRSSSALAAGLCLVAFGVFGRPEMLVAGLPLLVLVWSTPRELWSRPAVVAASTWVGGLAILRLVSLSGLASAAESNLMGPWSVLPFGEILTTSALLPYWLWAPVPLGAFWLRGRARVVVLSGLAAGLVPVHVTPTMFDRTETYLEFFRYGTFALPWLALLAGAGLACLVAVLSRALPRIAPAAAAAIVVLLVATPLINRDYLAIRYGPAADEEVFRQALTHVPPECRLIVPDDQLHLDTLKRYVEIARDVASQNPDGISPSSLIGISGALTDPPREGCWYFYSGTYCHDGFEGIPPTECRDLLERFPFEPVWSRDIEYRSHRLVSRPKRTVSPWYEPRLTLSLYRLKSSR